MATTKKNPKHVDYEKDLHSWMRTGTDKVSGRVKKLEDLKKLKHTPEALAKMGVSLVGTPFAAMASGAVNKYTDISENKKEPSIYSSAEGAKKFREGQNEIKRESKGMKSGGRVKGFRDGGIYTADMGQPPQDIDGGSAPPKKTASKKSEAPKRSMTPMDKKNAAYMELQAAKEKETKGLQLPTGGKAAKMGDKSLSPRSASAKAAAAAYDKVQNMRESEREVAEERLRRASKSEKNSYAKGGSVSKRADGIAQRGKTNCKIC
jgi:hypothetical protein